MRKPNRGSSLSRLLVVAALSAGLVLAWLALGRRGASDGKKIRLVLAIAGGLRERPLYEGAAAEFVKDHPGVEVETRVIGGRYYQKVLVMMAGRVAPDLMWMGQSFSEFAERGAFLDVTDRMAKEVDTRDFLPQALSWYRMNGRQLGIPFAVDIQFLAYNKALFDEAGVAYPTDEWDFEEFLDKAKRLTIDKDGDGRIDQYGLKGQLDRSLFGAEFISADGRRATCNTPEMIEYLQTNLDLAYKHHVVPTPEESQQEGLDHYTLFIQGRAAMMTMYTWNLPWLADRFADVDWDLALNPKVKQRGQWASSQAIVISADTRHPDEAWQLSKVFFGEKFQKAMSFRGLPSNLKVAREVIAARRGKPANLGALYTARDFLYPTPRVPHLQELQSLWSQGCATAWARRATPAEAMERAQRQLARATKKLYRKRE